MREFPLRFSESGGVMPLGYNSQGCPGPTGPTGPAGPGSEYTFDTVPTENSQNPVTSGGVYAALPRVEASESVAVTTQTPSGGGTVYQPQVSASWLKGRILDWFYPVGSIYISTNSTSPETLFGGTWEQIKDTFLLAAGDTYEAGSTGGEATHKLLDTEMPVHRHAGWVGTGTGTGTTVGAQIITGPADWKEVGLFSFTHAAGGGQAHNNMPPYLAVYAWKRVQSIQIPMDG